MRSSWALTAAFSRSRSLAVGFFLSKRFASFSSDLRKVDGSVAFFAALDLERLGADRAVEQLVDALQHVGDVWRVARVADELGECPDRATAHRELGKVPHIDGQDVAHSCALRDG